MLEFRDALKKGENGKKGLAIKTVNDYLEFYSAVFNHAVTTGRININPVKGLMLSDKRNPQDLTDVFDNEDLKKLFQSKEYNEDRQKRPYKFWVPILGVCDFMNLYVQKPIFSAVFKPIAGLTLRV